MTDKKEKILDIISLLPQDLQKDAILKIIPASAVKDWLDLKVKESDVVLKEVILRREAKEMSLGTVNVSISKLAAIVDDSNKMKEKLDAIIDNITRVLKIMTEESSKRKDIQ